jgi:hypothetical protein
MTNQELQMCVNGILFALEENLCDYELTVNYYDKITIIHPEISNITLPSENVSNITKPRDLAKVVWGLVDQIIKNGDEWLEQEKEYWVNLKENQEESNWESKRDYKD